MPFDLDKVNFIVRAIMDPCDAPLEVWLETLFPALLKFLWSYFQPSWLDILTAYARPSRAIGKARGGRKGSHGKRGSRWKRINPFAFDTSEFVGKNLAGFTDASSRSVSSGVIHLWTWFGFLERIFFWWFVISLIIDFFFNWFSQLYKTEYCSENLRAVVRTTGPTQGAIGIMNWFGGNWSEVEKIRGPITFNYAATTIGAYEVLAMLAATATDVGLGTGGSEAGIRLRIVTGPQSGVRFTHSEVLPPHGSAGLAVSAKIKGPCTFVIEISAFAGAAVFTDKLYSCISVEENPGG